MATTYEQPKEVMEALEKMREMELIDLAFYSGGLRVILNELFAKGVMKGQETKKAEGKE